MGRREELLERIRASGAQDPMIALERSAGLAEVLAARRGIPIRECVEPLVDASKSFPGWEPHPYRTVGAPYGSNSPYSLRVGVLRRLEKARALLGQSAGGAQLCIVDAYRPLTVQRFMLDYNVAALARDRGIAPERMDCALREELTAEVLRLWAAPDADSASPPPHSTGAAVDVTLMDEQGAPIDMGGHIDSSGPESLPNFYVGAASEKGRAYPQRRELLRNVMTAAGFCRIPNEWWHFSYGDQMWALLAWLASGVETTAIYGRVE